ncbi:hypothetical protein [Hymenobacter terrenus]|uniref:hypothetical protein n=1 Tax=Hymenobacter terrenus TaxID=1629124 RepID=UPI000619F0CE|nr:hypothetical protein [Hymenobacter terrenus]
MKHLRPTLFLLFVAALSLTNCKKDAEPTAQTDGLIGTWELVDRQYSCLPGPTPNETAVFTATGFSFYENGQLKSSGTYTFGTATPCQSTPVPGLRFVYTSGSIEPLNVAYTLTEDELVLDQGIPCDAPRTTYQRLP